MAVSEAVITVLASVSDIPNPAPADPTGGSSAISLLISFAKYGVLVICGVAAVASGGFMAVGKLSHRPDAAEKGKLGLIWSGIGAVVGVAAIPLVNGIAAAAGG